MWVRGELNRRDWLLMDNHVTHLTWGLKLAGLNSGFGAFCGLQGLIGNKQGFRAETGMIVGNGLVRTNNKWPRR